jgi:hypothetical protein
VYRFLPETKGLSVEEVVRTFEREAESPGSQTTHVRQTAPVPG